MQGEKRFAFFLARLVIRDESTFSMNGTINTKNIMLKKVKHQMILNTKDQKAEEKYGLVEKVI